MNIVREKYGQKADRCDHAYGLQLSGNSFLAPYRLYTIPY